MRRIQVFPILLFVLLSISLSISGAQNERGDKVTKILQSLFENYDKRVRPNFGGAPVKVGVTAHVISVSSVSEWNNDFTMDLYFRQKWTDPRLSFSVPDIFNLNVGSEVAQRIWVPDTFFANEKSAYFHLATAPNTFVQISPNGEVFRSIRLTITASCPMNLRRFPMDRQTCKLELESYGFSAKDIVYEWGIKNGTAVFGISKDAELPNFRILGHQTKVSNVILSSGEYSRLEVLIHFQRSVRPYLIQLYIPTIMWVLISFVSFWLHRNSITARVLIALSSIFSLSLIAYVTNASMPKITYTKASDCFMGISLTFAFASLLEFATVCYIAKQKEGRSDVDPEDQDPDRKLSSNSSERGLKGFQNRMVDRIRPAQLDKFSRILFPFSYFGFLALYSICYCLTREGEIEGLVAHN